MSLLAIPSSTLNKQATASRPDLSAWVSANAGSGKTFVLAQRVIRILLNGTPPSKILCLTFTKAAASEMANRVFENLGAWTMMSDTALAEALHKLEGRTITEADLARARRLFAAALETPGGLKIQTIHAFCERLLHLFPFEANIAGHFSVLDDNEAANLLADARAAVLARGFAAPETPLGQALVHLMENLSDFRIEEGIAAFVNLRDPFQRWVDGAGSLDAALADLRVTLGLMPHETLSTIQAAFMGEMPMSERDLESGIAALLASKGKTDRDAAQYLQDALAAETIAEQAASYCRFFLTQKGTFRKKLVTNAVADANPAFAEAVEAEKERLDSLLEKEKAARSHDATAAIVRLAHAVIQHFERAKRARGLLDYNDLIIKTAELLSTREASAWVHYKLDQGLDHILIDEAQDTSPRQWQVIEAMAEDFFAGESAREMTRTIFAVGDEKQSIYSFQGAEPAAFSAMRRAFGAAAKRAGKDWETILLALSFRSTPDVLQAVDRVFAGEEAHKGLSADPGAPVHEALRQKDPGFVEVWPLEEPGETPEIADWDSPLDHLAEKSPPMRVAERIATTIRGWLDRGERLEGTGARIKPGDVLVLVRKRKALAEAIIRTLKDNQIPVAGADRLKLTEHIAVMDLMALGRFCLLPEDDLTLATVLKSPLIGLSEEALYALAHDRKTKSLWYQLERVAEGKETVPQAFLPVCQAAYTRLRTWLGQADFKPPYEFYASLIGPDGARQRFLARLGAEAEDALDEFLAIALTFEETGVPTLERFLAWLEETAPEIKRDMDLGRDEVRVMTVHGSKGLEAPIVFLPDTVSTPHASQDPDVLIFEEAHESVTHRPPPTGMVWNIGQASQSEAATDYLSRKREEAWEEYRRLLYVGLTRARDRVYVAGFGKRNKRFEGSWYDLVEQALVPEAEDIKEAGEITAWRWQGSSRKHGAALQGDETREAGTDGMPTALPMPDWLNMPAPAPPLPERRIVPSDAAALYDAPHLRRHFEERLAILPDSEGAGEGPLAADQGRNPARNAGRIRGTLIHKLLEILADIPAETRHEAGSRLLSANRDAEALDHEALLDHALRALDNPDLAPYLTQDSVAEANLAGHVRLPDGEDVMVNGQVDRLAISQQHVYCLDFKTNVHVPAKMADVPSAYIMQLALYRALLQKLYPEKKIVSALYWTTTQSLMVLDEAVLAARVASEGEARHHDLSRDA